ncbi:MAG TPA: sigma-70 family RNA polymerase sigma factor [Anaerolineae bacterium]|nr:sigma-70 family RNA polymerase sigma factor [Anaerolineae bacterium]
MNEQAMIAAAQRGDVPSFNQLVRSYQALVYHTAYRVLGEGDAASDATQDAFVNAYKNIRSFRGGSFKAWLLRIVTNACYDQLRAKQRKPTASLDALLVDPDNPAPGLGEAQEEAPHEYAERQELAAWIDKGLQSLPYDQRITLVLSDIDGFAYEEIAIATNTNVGTVKSRLSRARAHMRDFLLQQQELLPESYRLKRRTEEPKSVPMENA